MMTAFSPFVLESALQAIRINVLTAVKHGSTLVRYIAKTHRSIKRRFTQQVTNHITGRTRHDTMSTRQV